MTRRNSCSTLPARANRSGVWSRRQPSHYMTLYGAPRHRMAVIQLTISHKKRETFILKSVKNYSLLKEGNIHFTASYGSLKKDPRELSDWRLIHNVKFPLRRLASFVHFFWTRRFKVVIHRQNFLAVNANQQVFTCIAVGRNSVTNAVADMNCFNDGPSRSGINMSVSIWNLEYFQYFPVAGIFSHVWVGGCWDKLCNLRTVTLLK